MEVIPMGALRALLAVVGTLFATRAALAAENLSLQQQLLLLRRSVKRPKLCQRDRIFWVWLSRVWSD